MRQATKTVAGWFGVLAGFAGLEHGYFEIQQGNTSPAGIMFASMGSPCVPERSWSACEPAMSLIPNFLITGVVTVLLGVLILIWAGAFVQRTHGGAVLIGLSVVLLLLGGGFFPPLFGVLGGLAGTRISQPLSRRTISNSLRFAATLWPWPLVILVTWSLGQFPVGYVANDFLQSIMGFGLLVILGTLVLSLYSAYAHDVRSQVDGT